jgi:polar amino acid transport system substrate-binding protein
MMNRIFLPFLTLLSVTLLNVTLLSSHALATETVRIYGYGINASTYINTSKELRGKHHGGRQAFLTELVRKLMITLNNTPDIRRVEQAVQPMPLELKAAESVFGIDRTASTESQYKWIGPLLSDSAYFIDRKGSSSSIKSIDDARKVSSICVHRDSPQVSTLNKMGFKNVTLAASYERCWQSVADGTSALTTISAALFPAITKSVGAVAEKVARTQVRLYEDEVYLAFSNATSDAMVDQWRRGLEEIKISAHYHSLIHHYYCQQNCF